MPASLETTSRSSSGSVARTRFLRRSTGWKRPRKGRLSNGSVNRYFASSLTHYSRLGRNWNRTFELEPADLRGAAVLVTVSPIPRYSMGILPSSCASRGSTRSHFGCWPWHVPAGLIDADWADWLAAVRMGMRHARQRAGPNRPLLLVGYSNGGALAVKYATEALDRPQDRLPIAAPAPRR